MLSISRPPWAFKAILALVFMASEIEVLAFLASTFDLKQNSKSAINMAKTKNPAKKKNTPTTLAKVKVPAPALPDFSGHCEFHHFLANFSGILSLIRLSNAELIELINLEFLEVAIP